MNQLRLIIGCFDLTLIYFKLMMTSLRINFANILDVHPRPISCMRLNEKTKQLALYRGGEFGSIELWDVSYQPCLIKHFIDIEKIDGKPSVESIVWSQGRLFSAGLHGFVVEHDLSSGRIKNKTAATSGPVWCLAVKPDETQIAASTEDGFINIFDVVNDNLLYLKVLDRQEGRVLCIDWSPCGSYIASGSVDSVRLWDVEKGHAIQRLITGRSKNKETIVWSIAMLENLTIVSGDSRGIVSFWDGRVGVLKFKLVTHKADILTLKLSQDKTQLYAAGVDPAVIIMNRIVNTDKWVKSHPRNMHTNDVLTLETYGRILFSGGMDADFVMSSFPPKIVTKIPPLPKQPFIFQSDQGYVLVQKEASVNIWRLPTADVELQKLLEFQTKGGDPIFSCCLSPSGKLFAYSTLNDVRFFLLEDVKGNAENLPKLRRLRLDNQEEITNKFWRLNFLTDDHILAISADGRKAAFLQVEKAIVHVTEVLPGPLFDEEIQVAEEMQDGISDVIVSKGQYICINSNNSLSIYRIDVEDTSFEKICSVPKYFARVTSFTFHPEKPLLLITFSDHCIQVYNFEIGKIEFCEKIKKKFDDLQPILGAAWVDDGNAAVIYQVDGMYLLKIVVNEEPSKKSRKSALKESKEKYDFFLKNSEAKYKYIAYMGSHTDQSVLAVEVSPNSIIEKLPPAFAKKRFGT